MFSKIQCIFHLVSVKKLKLSQPVPRMYFVCYVLCSEWYGYLLSLVLSSEKSRPVVNLTGTQGKLRHLLAIMENCLGEAAPSQVGGKAAVGLRVVCPVVWDPRNNGYVELSRHWGYMTSHCLNLTAMLLGMWHLVPAHLSGHLPLPFPRQTIQQESGYSLAFCPIPGLVVFYSLLLPGLRLGSGHHRLQVFSAVFFLLPRATATCQATQPSGRGTLSITPEHYPL